ncbi:MAG: hypothetical protein ACRD32_02070 [Nitrososphaerales archaeon]
MQAEINGAMKKLKLTPIQTIALHCFLSRDSRKNLDEASKVFGLDLRDVIKHVVES